MTKKITRQDRINRFLDLLAQTGPRLPADAPVHEVHKVACTLAGRMAIGTMPWTKEVDNYLTPEAASLFNTLYDAAHWEASRRHEQLDGKNVSFVAACRALSEEFGLGYPPAKCMLEAALAESARYVGVERLRLDEAINEAAAGMFVRAVYHYNNRSKGE